LFGVIQGGHEDGNGEEECEWEEDFFHHAACGVAVLHDWSLAEGARWTPTFGRVYGFWPEGRFIWGSSSGCA
jgi:hypothetical protein